MLDSPRLGKQRVETLQIMQVLARHRIDPTSGLAERHEPKGWRTHPAVLMWQGYEPALAAYQETICREWTGRGFRDTCESKTQLLLRAAQHSGTIASSRLELPPWLGDPELHRSHQSNLIRKHPERYAPVFPGVPPDIAYAWPVVVDRQG